MIDEKALIDWLQTAEGRFKHITTALEALINTDQKLEAAVGRLGAGGSGSNESFDHQAYNSLLDAVAELSRKVDEISHGLDEVTARIENLEAAKNEDD